MGRGRREKRRHEWEVAEKPTWVDSHRWLPPPPAATAPVGKGKCGVDRRWRSLVAPETPQAERREGVLYCEHFVYIL